MAKLPPHFFVYGALFTGIVGGIALSISQSMVYPWQLWFVDMMDAEMVKAYEAPMRASPEGSVARGTTYGDEPQGTSLIRMTPEGQARSNPYTVDDAFLEQGEWAFMTYCAPCHGANADGKGTVTDNTDGKKRFQIPAPALVGPTGIGKIRSDGYIYYTIRNGGALMPSYGVQLSDEEMWGVVAYIRTLEKKG
jgi:mono/diheme cytochrome c family protein